MTLLIRVTILSLTLVLAQATAAPPSLSGQVGQSAPVTLPLTRHFVSRNSTTGHGKRQAGSGTAALANYHNSFFTVPVQVGTPAQNLQLVVDTASYNMYVYGAGCVGMDPASTPFRAARSRTYSQAQREGADVLFGDGSEVRGAWVADTVGFAGTKRVPKQKFILAERVDNEIWKGKGLHVAPDGVMGFSMPLPKDMPDKYPPWYYLTKGANQMFSIYMRQRSQPPGDRPAQGRGGEVTLGGINTRCVADDPAWNNVVRDSAGQGSRTRRNPRNQWVIAMNPQLQVGETAINIQPSTARALIDTASAQVYGPERDVLQFYARAFPASWNVRREGTRFRLHDTRRLGTPLHVSFFFNGHEYDIARGELWYPDGTDDRGNTKWYGFMEINGPYEQDPHNEVPWVIGTPLLMNVYTTFRMSQSGAQVGFSPLKQTPAGGDACLGAA